ncbi:transcriptional regulator, SARP family [Thermotoga petrophila RKU-1]|uniref:Transcriptional regulator, SARP family n=1 Tax=Thermotoga petrophila (strain ATCC BAA-488 / DSM 13995 / JCM 10881 / RKU-1) TaxID=390874 RepID=A5IN57_THEP1|nr:BTAD domain-containing putative transcriptional regulator [Thermotoga petrophila]ABQ47630.1 transcriptional regulator, SARP family [Thermotoga petrophila RKU-1]
MSIFVKTFGGTRVIKDGDFVNARDWPSQKAFALFRYLVFRGNEEVSVEEIYNLFWEGMDDTFAKSNLNTTLHIIRKTTGITSEQLFVKGDLCCFFPGNEITIDVDVFEECHKSLMKTTSDTEREKLLKKMFEIYTGPFLIEDIFAEWIQEIREIYESWYSDVLKELFELYLSKKDYNAALEMVNVYFQREPYDEDMYYRTIEVLLKKGEITRAKRVYDRLSSHLMEIGIKPRLKFDDFLSKRSSEFMLNGNKAIVVDEKLFEKFLFLESRRREKSFVLVEVKLTDKSINTEDVSQKVAFHLRKGDVITFSGETIRILFHCPEQRRPTMEKRVVNTLEKIGLKKGQYEIS